MTKSVLPSEENVEDPACRIEQTFSRRTNEGAVSPRGTDFSKIAAVVFCLITIAAFYPGVMSPDSIDMLKQAETGVYRETSAPIMSLLWRILHFFIWGPAPMFILQVGAWWTGLWLIFSRLAPTRQWVRIVGMAVIGFWPPLFAMIGTIWNCVHMTIAYSLALGLLLKNEESARVGELSFAGLLVAYGTGVRTNAVFSSVPLAAWVSGCLWKMMKGRVLKQLKWAVVTVLMVAIVFGGRIANKAVNAVPFTALQNVLVFDLVGISARTGTNLVPEAIRNGCDLPFRIASFYTAFTCVPIYYGKMKNGVWNEERILMTDNAKVKNPDGALTDMRSAWWAAVRAEPRAYLKHRTAVFLANMGWNDMPPHYPFERGIAWNEFNLKTTPSRFSERVYSVLNSLLRKAQWMFRPWLYLLLTLSVAMACLGCRFTTHLTFPRTVALIFSSLLYTLPYFFVAPAADLRYHHWPMEAALLTVPLFCYELSKRRNVRDDRTGRRVLITLLGVAGLCSMIAGGISLAVRPGTIYFGEAAPKPEAAVVANNKGLEVMRKGDYRTASGFFHEASSHALYWYVPYINLAIAGNADGRKDEAEAYYDRAVSLDTSSGEALRYRGRFRLAKRDFAGALSDFEQAAGRGVDGYDNCLDAAKSAAALGKAEACAGHSLSCLRLDRERFSRDSVAIAEPYFKDPALVRAGLEYFKRLEEHLPDAWWVHYNLGTLLTLTGDKIAAEEAYGRANALRGTEAEPASPGGLK